MAAQADADDEVSEAHSMFGGMVQPGMMSTGQGTVPVFFVNGLSYGVTSTELTVMLMFSNQPTAALVLAPAMAKTLGESLVRLVTEYEQKTGQTVKSLADLQQFGT